MERVGAGTGAGGDHAHVPGIACDRAKRPFQRSLNPNLERLEPGQKPAVGEPVGPGRIDDDDAGLLHERASGHPRI